MTAPRHIQFHQHYPHAPGDIRSLHHGDVLTLHPNFQQHPNITHFTVPIAIAIARGARVRFLEEDT